MGDEYILCFTASPVSACIAELRLNDDTFTSPYSVPGYSYRLWFL
jgi:hypothetical protein